MAKSSAMSIAEEVTKRAWELAAEYRGARVTEADRHEQPKSTVAKNWWGPKAYKFRFFLQPWQYLTLVSNARAAGMSPIQYIIATACTDSHLVAQLREAGIARQKKIEKKAGKVLAMKRKAPAPVTPAPHYGLPTRRRVVHA